MLYVCLVLISNQCLYVICLLGTDIKSVSICCVCVVFVLSVCAFGIYCIDELFEFITLSSS